MNIPLEYSRVPMAPSHRAGVCLMRASRSAAICLVGVHFQNSAFRIQPSEYRRTGVSCIQREDGPYVGSRFSSVTGSGAIASAIIPYFALKSLFFLRLGA